MFAIDRPAAQEIEDHAGLRLAPIAVAPVFGNHRLDVVGTVADIVDPRPGQPQLAAHMSVHRVDIGLAVIAARDTGLVGHDKDIKPLVVERLDRLPRARDPAEPLDLADKAVILVDHPVAVEKRCGTQFWDQFIRGHRAAVQAIKSVAGCSRYSFTLATNDAASQPSTMR